MGYVHIANTSIQCIPTLETINTLARMYIYECYIIYYEYMMTNTYKGFIILKESFINTTLSQL